MEASTTQAASVPNKSVVHFKGTLYILTEHFTIVKTPIVFILKDAIDAYFRKKPIL